MTYYQGLKKTVAANKIPEEEKIYKHQPTSTLNVPTLVLLLITVISVYISSREKHKPNLGAESPFDNDEKSNVTMVTAPNSTTAKPVTTDFYKERRVGDVGKLRKDTMSGGSSGDGGGHVTKKRTLRRSEITNRYDKKIQSKIYDGEHLLNKGQYAECIIFFEELLQEYSLSPRIFYGLAECLRKLGEKMKSNALVSKAIQSYAEVGAQPDVPLQLAKLAAITQAKAHVFMGQVRKAIVTLEKLCKMVPEDPDCFNELGISYMELGSYDLAAPAFQHVLKLEPRNGIAMVHLGFILKTQSRYEECIPYLLQGIRSGEDVAFDSRFYFQLGDAYTRLGHSDKAWQIYHEAAEKRLFPSAEQRSLYNSASTLRAQPWWIVEDTGYGKDIGLLEYHWKTIRDEALSIAETENGAFRAQRGEVVEQGEWLEFELYSQGTRRDRNCALVPKTCEIVSKMENAVGNKRGEIKFSLMEPGTHVWPHTSPTNCRLRTHLGLVVPKNTHLRVGGETRAWRQGKVLIIDDSFDHEIWHDGDSRKLVLIVDFWHPDIPMWERNRLLPIWS